VQHPTVATQPGFGILPITAAMKKIGSILPAIFLLCIPLSQLTAQSEDPSDIFLKAYMTAQQGEKLERENEFKEALAKYRFAGSLIEQLRKSHPEWQPAIVDYRGHKISESILRVQDKASTQKELTAEPPQLPENPPTVLEGSSSAGNPATEIVEPSGSDIPAEQPPPPQPAATPDEAAIRAATRKLQSKVDQLEADLQKAHSQYGAAQKEKDALSSQLKETTSKLEKAQGDLKESKQAEQQVRDQLATAQGTLKKIQATSGGDAKAQAALRAEIANLKKALASVEKGRTEAEHGRAAAEKERDQANAKAAAADTKVTSATKERDDALAQLKSIKGAEGRVEALIAENSALKKKLADAEQTVREISEDKPKREKELADVKKQIGELRDQLAASQKENKEYEIKVASLNSQLDQAEKQLQKARLTGATPEETAKLTKENEMLRAIIVRERQEEARREQAKKLMLAEFAKLDIKSETLTKQIELLAQPITRLTPDELALLRQPVVSISDDNPGALQASFTFAKKSDVPVDAARTQPPENAISAAQIGPASGLPETFRPNVPDNVLTLAWRAKKSFDRGKYRTAERTYQEILTKSPNNLYSLSNLGVVYFRTGKLKAAELTLKKAVVIAPKDEFARTTLGIVFYREDKFDNALTELTKALAINPKSATAHNYLGITASQKGWQEAAEKELLQAVSDDPNYADAHFNLAVIYATEQPPSKELARQHYERATELGSPPDPALERLLH
jgi:Flp pilus assembly protein TadD/predicted  nucleic acid-binding Zn-ribbon protein